MNPELQTVVDRLELVERQARGWKMLAVLALFVALAALVLPWTRPSATVVTPVASDRARYRVVEAQRFLLRDLDGRAAGGMEATADGALRLVLGSGYGPTGAAFLEVQKNGIVHLTMRGPDGSVRAALIGSHAPSLALSSQGQHSGAVLASRADGAGALTLIDDLGRTRFRAP